MSVNIFVKVGDVVGESRDSRHKEEIEALSWAWGLSNPGEAPGGSETGRVTFQNLTFTHHVDKASPGLMLACASRTTFADARLTVRKTGTTTPHEFVSIRLEDVLVVGVESTGTTEAGSLLERVTLGFARVDFEYKPQKVDGSFDEGVHFRWDVQNNATF